MTRCARRVFGCLSALLLISPAAVVSAQRGNGMRSFYIATAVFSDDLSSSFDEILDATQVGDDVRVRVIRISLSDRECGGDLLRAVERVLPHTTLEKIAGTNLCAFKPDEVDAAIEAAVPKHAYTVTETASRSVVAQCGTGEKEFWLPWPEKFEKDAVKRVIPHFQDLWVASFHARHLALGERDADVAVRTRHAVR